MSYPTLYQYPVSELPIEAVRIAIASHFYIHITDELATPGKTLTGKLYEDACEDASTLLDYLYSLTNTFPEKKEHPLPTADYVQQYATIPIEPWEYYMPTGLFAKEMVPRLIHKHYSDLCVTEKELPEGHWMLDLYDFCAEHKNPLSFYLAFLDGPWKTLHPYWEKFGNSEYDVTSTVTQGATLTTPLPTVASLSIKKAARELCGLTYSTGWLNPDFAALNNVVLDFFGKEEAEGAPDSSEPTPSTDKTLVTRMQEQFFDANACSDDMRVPRDQVVTMAQCYLISQQPPVAKIQVPGPPGNRAYGWSLLTRVPPAFRTWINDQHHPLRSYAGSDQPYIEAFLAFLPDEDEEEALHLLARGQYALNEACGALLALHHQEQLAAWIQAENGVQAPLNVFLKAGTTLSPFCREAQEELLTKTTENYQKNVQQYVETLSAAALDEVSTVS